jgi:hypothetical protein
MPFCDSNHFLRTGDPLCLRRPWGYAPVKESRVPRPVTARGYPSKSASKAASLMGALASPEFIAIGIFCAIGLLLTLNVMLRFPDFGAMMG